MPTKTHFVLAFCSCLFGTACIVNNSSHLIGLLHGPSDEINASNKYQSLQDKLIALGAQNDYGWPWEDTESTDLVFASYNDMAYQDHRALILRDAGIIGAVFAMILALANNFMSVSYSVSKRLRFLLLASPLYLAPGLAGQLVFQKSIPIEIIMLKTWGVAKGLAYVGYCSGRALLIGLGGGTSSDVSTIHDLKVVATSCLLVFIMGLISWRK